MDVEINEHYFLPSEIARLVLGYLQEVKCKLTYKCFLKESKDLVEYSTLLKRGITYPTDIMGMSLISIVNECAALKLQETKTNQMAPSTASLWRQHDILSKNLKKASQTKLRQKESQTTRTRKLNQKKKNVKSKVEKFVITSNDTSDEGWVSESQCDVIDDSDNTQNSDDDCVVVPDALINRPSKSKGSFSSNSSCSSNFKTPPLRSNSKRVKSNSANKNKSGDLNKNRNGKDSVPLELDNVDNTSDDPVCKRTLRSSSVKNPISVESQSTSVKTAEDTVDLPIDQTGKKVTDTNSANTSLNCTVPALVISENSHVEHNDEDNKSVVANQTFEVSTADNCDNTYEFETTIDANKTFDVLKGGMETECHPDMDMSDVSARTNGNHDVEIDVDDKPAASHEHPDNKLNEDTTILQQQSEETALAVQNIPVHCSPKKTFRPIAMDENSNLKTPVKSFVLFNSDHKSPRRKRQAPKRRSDNKTIMGGISPDTSTSSRFNITAPDVTDENTNYPELLEKLLGDTKLHEKLAENINKKFAPIKDSVCEVPVDTKAQQPVLEQDDEQNYDNTINVSNETFNSMMGDVIKGIAEMTGSDPSFESLFTLFLNAKESSVLEEVDEMVAGNHNTNNNNANNNNNNNLLSSQRDQLNTPPNISIDIIEPPNSNHNNNKDNPLTSQIVATKSDLAPSSPQYFCDNANSNSSCSSNIHQTNYYCSQTNGTGRPRQTRGSVSQPILVNSSSHGDTNSQGVPGSSSVVNLNSPAILNNHGDSNSQGVPPGGYSIANLNSPAISVISVPSPDPNSQPTPERRPGSQVKSRRPKRITPTPLFGNEALPTLGKIASPQKPLVKIPESNKEREPYVLTDNSKQIQPFQIQEHQPLTLNNQTITSNNQPLTLNCHSVTANPTVQPCSVKLNSLPIGVNLNGETININSALGVINSNGQQCMQNSNIQQSTQNINSQVYAVNTNVQSGSITTNVQQCTESSNSQNVPSGSITTNIQPGTVNTNSQQGSVTTNIQPGTVNTNSQQGSVTTNVQSGTVNANSPRVKNGVSHLNTSVQNIISSYPDLTPSEQNNASISDITMSPGGRNLFAYNQRPFSKALEENKSVILSPITPVNENSQKISSTPYPISIPVCSLADVKSPDSKFKIPNKSTKRQPRTSPRTSRSPRSPQTENNILTCYSLSPLKQEAEILHGQVDDTTFMAVPLGRMSKRYCHIRNLDFGVEPTGTQSKEPAAVQNNAENVPKLKTPMRRLVVSKTCTKIQKTSSPRSKKVPLVSSTSDSEKTSAKAEKTSAKTFAVPDKTLANPEKTSSKPEKIAAISEKTLSKPEKKVRTLKSRQSSKKQSTSALTSTSQQGIDFHPLLTLSRIDELPPVGPLVSTSKSRSRKTSGKTTTVNQPPSSPKSKSNSGKSSGKTASANKPEAILEAKTNKKSSKTPPATEASTRKKSGSKGTKSPPEKSSSKRKNSTTPRKKQSQTTQRIDTFLKVKSRDPEVNVHGPADVLDILDADTKEFNRQLQDVNFVKLDNASSINPLYNVQLTNVTETSNQNGGHIETSNQNGEHIENSNQNGGHIETSNQNSGHIDQNETKEAAEVLASLSFSNLVPPDAVEPNFLQSIDLTSSNSNFLQTMNFTSPNSNCAAPTNINAANSNCVLPATFTSSNSNCVLPATFTSSNSNCVLPTTFTSSNLNCVLPTTFTSSNSNCVTPTNIPTANSNSIAPTDSTTANSTSSIPTANLNFVAHADSVTSSSIDLPTDLSMPKPNLVAMDLSLPKWNMAMDLSTQSSVSVPNSTPSQTQKGVKNVSPIYNGIQTQINGIGLPSSNQNFKGNKRKASESSNDSMRSLCSPQSGGEPTKKKRKKLPDLKKTDINAFLSRIHK